MSDVCSSCLDAIHPAFAKDVIKMSVDEMVSFKVSMKDLICRNMLLIVSGKLDEDNSTSFT